mgnify:CR=1 FL=1
MKVEFHVGTATLRNLNKEYSMVQNMIYRSLLYFGITEEYADELAVVALMLLIEIGRAHV